MADIRFSIDLSEEQIHGIAGALGIRPEELGGWLDRIAKASLTEYVQMFIGDSIPATTRHYKELRLLLLILHAFEQCPGESRVASLFNITQTEAKTLVNNVLAKHRRALSGRVRETCMETIRSGTRADEEGVFEVSIGNTAVLTYINQLIAEKKPALRRVYLRRDTASVYVIRRDTHDFLCSEFGITPNGE